MDDEIILSKIDNLNFFKNFILPSDQGLNSQNIIILTTLVLYYHLFHKVLDFLKIQDLKYQNQTMKIMREKSKNHGFSIHELQKRKKK